MVTSGSAIARVKTGLKRNEISGLKSCGLLLTSANMVQYVSVVQRGSLPEQRRGLS